MANSSAQEVGGTPLARSGRTTLRRRRDRGTYDRAVADAILDEGLIAHVAVVDGGFPVVQPMAYARIDDRLYLHGARANRTLSLLAGGAPGCVEITILDGLVLARSAFHHSMNARSVMLFGTATEVDDPAEQLAASAALVDHLVPGRAGDARPPSEAELRKVLIVRFPIDEGSVKVRSGMPVDDDEDLGLAVWAGVLPVHTVAGALESDPGLPTGLSEPDYSAAFTARHATDG